MQEESIILYIVLRQSVHPNTPYCAANAVEYILMKYFTLQVLAAKTHIQTLENDIHIKTTTKWLASNSKKIIISVDDTVWDKVKQEFHPGIDAFFVRGVPDASKENVLVLWPLKESLIPSYLKL